MDSPRVSLEKIFSCFHLCTPHFDHDYDGHYHRHAHHFDHDHDYLCKADGTAVVSVKRNSQLVIVPQGVRCALGLKQPNDDDYYL